MSEGFRGVRGVLGASRDPRYSGQKGIGHQGVLEAPRGCRGCQGVMGLAGTVGTQGLEGVSVVCGGIGSS